MWWKWSVPSACVRSVRLYHLAPRNVHVVIPCTRNVVRFHDERVTVIFDHRSKSGLCAGSQLPCRIRERYGSTHR